MKDIMTSLAYDLGGLSRADWIEKVEDIAEEHGHAEPIGPDHFAYFIDAGRTLFVTFESVASVRKNNDETAPIGWGFAQTHGWSSLTLMAAADTDWFRHPAMFGYFDRLIDDGFFDDFDQVLFYGAGSAGYAAAAFSVAAPDSKVLVIQPQATLDPALARWDHRYPEARRLDFTSRFGYAPQMVETARTVSVIHDPTVIEDAVHASLFNGENTNHFSCTYLGPDAQRGLLGMDVLPELIEQAMNDNLSCDCFAHLWRARRTHMPYLRTLLHRAEAEEGHERMLARYCRQISASGDRPLFAEKLAQLEASGVCI
ncbi:hypothetical protein L0666_00630 [Octadecabacter sp. CECT 8868]|uniref:hypothetical protein n=1 Tax=Octadecabacter algicola TaxID=2909342 RepID=UPI001F353097|nr:hypothetical protein [Octadecabacter algicola]MCF2903480.1 hypothetical protein [Octadecabacter algicola]